MLHKHFGEGHTVKPNQLTRVLPRHAGRGSHITILCQVWFSYVVGPLTPRPHWYLPPIGGDWRRFGAEAARLTGRSLEAAWVSHSLPEAFYLVFCEVFR